ncbi:flagellar basal body P-ring formation chaperone FlgA [Caminibacter profundus]
MIILLPLFLLATVQNEIISFYKKEYPNIIIEKIKSSKPFPKKYKNIKFLINPKSPSGSIKIDNSYYYIKIKAQIPVFKATQIIKQNSPILENINIKKEIVNFRFFYSKPLIKIPNNLIASKIISKNTIINESNTKIAPSVLRGERVTVIINSQNIKIYSKAKALKDGNIGEIIPIEMDKKIFNAKVIKKGIVTIDNN